MRLRAGTASRARRPALRRIVSTTATSPKRPDPRHPPDSGADESPPSAVETRMYRALAALRVVVLANAVILYVYRGVNAAGGPWSNTAHPAAGAVVMVALVAWTGYVVWAYDSPGRRTSILLVADLAVALAAILLSPVIKGPHLGATLPGFWVMGVVLAWGIHWNALGGLVAALAISVADLVVRYDVDTVTYSNLFLLLIGGPTVGYASGLLKEMAAARDRAEREAAEARERARLARVVHDGVLQVLALVQRRGEEIGGEAAHLAKLAGDQETALRAFVQQGPASTHPDGVSDLSTPLAALQSRHVTVSLPGTAVLLPEIAVGELLAVVRECLLNVHRHVGVDASAWVSVEDLGDRVVLSVRDDGPGIRPGRLDQARRQGRLGVAESIQGRVAALGGTVQLTSGPGQGTEWEVVIPRDGAAASDGLAPAPSRT